MDAHRAPGSYRARRNRRPVGHRARRWPRDDRAEAQPHAAGRGAQGLDYASWVETLDASVTAAIFAGYAKGRGDTETDLGTAFRARFGTELDENDINTSYQLVVVAATLDPATERIVAYLANRDVPIDVMLFQVYRHEETLLLGRSWLIDPAEVRTSAATVPTLAKELWNIRR